MASLAELYGQAATSYGKARAKARQIPANLRESGKGLASWAVDPYGEAQRVMGEYRTMTPEQRQGLVNAAVDLFGGVDVGPVGAIKASHGGPHLFDRFDFSKIGTGEGAQAYGHGGYFAQGFDSPVAVDYQQMLAGKEGLQPKIGGKSIGQLYNEIERKANRLPAEKANIEYNKLQFLEDLDQNSVFKHAFDRIEDENIKPWAASLQSQYEPGGHLYNVELKWPDAAREAADPLGEHHLLDWDVPLSEQSTFVKNKLGFLDMPSQERMDEVMSKMMTKAEKMFGDKYAWTDLPEAKLWQRRMGREIGKINNPDVSGAEFYRGSDLDVLHGATVPENERSNYLRSLGIPGIRYLDQSSRGQGEGTRNYVMFDDRFPNIVTRNGVSITDLLKNK